MIPLAAVFFFYRQDTPGGDSYVVVLLFMVTVLPYNGMLKINKECMHLNKKWLACDIRKFCTLVQYNFLFQTLMKVLSKFGAIILLLCFRLISVEPL